MNVATPALAILGCFAAACATSSAQASQVLVDIDEQLDRPASLAVSSSWLPVRVEAISGDKVSVRAVITGDEGSTNVDRIVITVSDDGELTIRQERPGLRRGARRERDQEGSITVGVPAGIPLLLDSASGDITVGGALSAAPVAVSTASGAIEIEDGVSATRLLLNTASGDVVVSGGADELVFSSASGDLRADLSRPAALLQVETASGAVDARGQFGDVRLSSTSGSLDVSSLMGSVEARSISGQINLSWAQLPPTARVSVGTTSGSQRLILPAGSNPGGSIETLSGQVSSDLPLLLTSQGARVLRLGGGQGTLDLSSVSGAIVIAGP